MINDIIFNFDNGILSNLIIDLLKFHYPEIIESYNLEIYTLPTLLNNHEKAKKLCIVLKDKVNSTIEKSLRIHVSRKQNLITFKKYNFLQENRIIDNYVSLEEIDDLDKFYTTIYENIIIT